MTDANGLSIDPLSGVVKYGAKAMTLPPKEARLLSLFLSGGDRVISREEILERVWGEAMCGSRVVDVNVYRLRKKLRSIGHPGIKTVFRRGYRLDAAENRPAA